MKLLRFALYALPPGAAAAVFGAACFLPSQIEVQQSVYLQRPPEEVYPYLNDPTEWQHWSVLSKENDPSMIHLYGGPFRGKGARLQWSGDRVGEGQLILTESTQPGAITYRQSTPGDTTTVHGTFILAPVEGGTHLIWRQHTMLPQSPLARLQGVLQKYRMQQEVAQGLQGLQKRVGVRKLERYRHAPPPEKIFLF